MRTFILDALLGTNDGNRGEEVPLIKSSSEVSSEDSVVVDDGADDNSEDEAYALAILLLERIDGALIRDFVCFGFLDREPDLVVAARVARRVTRLGALPTDLPLVASATSTSVSRLLMKSQVVFQHCAFTRRSLCLRRSR